MCSSEVPQTQKSCIFSTEGLTLRLLNEFFTSIEGDQILYYESPSHKLSGSLSFDPVLEHRKTSIAGGGVGTLRLPRGSDCKHRN